MLQVATIARTITSFLLPFGDHFRKMGWHVAAGAGDVQTARTQLESHFDRVHQVPWERSLTSPRNYTVVTRALQDLVRAERFDIVHVHTPIAAFLTRFALRNMRATTKVVYTAHGLHFDESSAWRHPIFWMERVASNWNDALILINRPDYEFAQKYRLAPTSRKISLLTRNWG
jgi:hypothetical protein